MKIRMIQSWIAPWRNAYNPGDIVDTTPWWAKELCRTNRAVLHRQEEIETTMLDTSACEQMVTRTIIGPPVTPVDPPEPIKRKRGRPRKVRPECP